MCSYLTTLPSPFTDIKIDSLVTLEVQKRSVDRVVVQQVLVEEVVDQVEVVTTEGKKN